MTTDNKDLPIFEDQDGGKMYPPYVLNNCQAYEEKVSMGTPEALGEMQRFTIMQAYFAGFAKGAGFTDMLFTSPEAEPVRARVLAAVKEELVEFSRLNRDFAKKAGLPIVTVKGGN